RGTTSKARVTSLKEAGAREVHFLVSCPPHINPCVYGIDFPERDKLMAATHTREGIREFLNADSLGYLTEEGMVRATGHPKDRFCLACFNGDYPVKFESTMEKHLLERRRNRVTSLGLEVAAAERQGQLL
ncbi:MAG: amidophosphoribosyltransferase, partial [Verrucomicrobiae bacterium]|nr:amidophosphoribosyltransferase [Verrucomicrobiae bacterium]